MFVLCKFFWEITDYYWIIKGKTFFIYGIWKKLQLNIRSASQIEQKFSRGTKMSERTSILKTSGYWFPTGFFSKRKSLLPREVRKSVSCIRSWKFNTFTLALVLKTFQNFKGVLIYL